MHVMIYEIVIIIVTIALLSLSITVDLLHSADTLHNHQGKFMDLCTFICYLDPL